VDISPAQVLALLATGIVGGIVSVVVSMASLVTYPVLLAMGLPPVTANVTNTVALVFNGFGFVIGSRPELAGQRPILQRMAVIAALGGATGAGLLLLLPDDWFELVAPVLIAGASVLLLLQPRLRERRWFHPRGVVPATVIAYFLTATYIGYFGAAGGIIALVVLGTIMDRPLPHINAGKGVLMTISNGVAAIWFVFVGPVRWSFVVPLAVGVFIGGLAGPWFVRRIPAAALRLLIGIAGIVVSVALARIAYLPA
jgi:uncharacterized membrane protein YfcA